MYFTIEKDIPFSKLNQWVIYFVYNLIKGARIHVRTHTLMMMLMIITQMPTITPILAINHMSTIIPMSNPSRVRRRIYFCINSLNPTGNINFISSIKDNIGPISTTIMVVLDFSHATVAPAGSVGGYILLDKFSEPYGYYQFYAQYQR